VMHSAPRVPIQTQVADSVATTSAPGPGAYNAALDPPGESTGVVPTRARPGNGWRPEPLGLVRGRRIVRLVATLAVAIAGRASRLNFIAPAC
jgi:hypothetical protein